MNLPLLLGDRLGRAQSSVCHSTLCVCTVIQMFTPQTPVGNGISNVCIDCKTVWWCDWLKRRTNRQSACERFPPIKRQMLTGCVVPDLSLTQVVGKMAREQNCAKQRERYMEVFREQPGNTFGWLIYISAFSESFLVVLSMVSAICIKITKCRDAT